MSVDHSAGCAPERAAGNPLLALLMRLHFYVGVFVGPFLFIAAASGIVYVLSPQMEPWLYSKALYSEARGPSLPLSRQVEIAEAFLDHKGTLIAVRPSPQTGVTTRVQFAESGLRPSESRAIFVDPVSGEVRGDHVVYGTSGVLPARGLIDQFHRGLLLGDFGRLYSELAASWLWIAALGGVVLWLTKRRRARAEPKAGQGMRRWHARLGLVLLLGLLFFSATGLTWSQYAGGNIGVLRQFYGWSTPSVATALNGAMDMPAGEHAEHMGHHMAGMTGDAPTDTKPFDAVLAAARQSGIDASLLEIRPARSADKAWTVTEIDRRWPSQVDAVAVDPHTLRVVDQVRFEDYPLAAKLTRWGIDLHMGVLFGFWNQVVLALFALGLAVMVVWGYLMWWRRRPIAYGYQGPLRTFLALGVGMRLWVLTTFLVLGICLPVLGASLVLFVLIDGVVNGVRHREHGWSQPGSPPQEEKVV
ncbi:PepSY-associated TM helix domain-containing protein [Pseudomonas matsuisoli]|uniref:Membrane protein n=1 Tax=Pseudomonas matsuisoli TaxID=1515666 RepID=A0A917UYR8_9PSED|nr:PepSY-associated TM helix domain-containing protein [Pseudomonas matsuisoli]GGJ97618.1 membrane protein [Pseudomonas matsuisoli]